MEALTISQLIEFLRSSFDREDFERATRIILSRQQALRGEIEREFLQELTRREVEKIELQARCDGLEREIAEERERYASLVARLVESGRGRAAARGEAEKCRRACEVLEAQIGRLMGGFDAACGMARGAQAKIGQLFEILREKKEAEEKMSAEIDGWKGKGAELEARVLEMVEESMRMRGRGKAPCLNGKREDHGSQSSARSLPKFEVGSRMIEINDSKDGMIVDADTHMGSEMVQIAEKNVGAVEDGDDRTSKKFILPASTHKRKCLSRIIACNSGYAEEKERFPLRKVRKLKKNTGNCSCSGNGIQGEKWNYEIDMLCAFAENTKLCMRAVCTLWRLQMHEEQSTKQTTAINYQGSDKFDTERVSTMVEFLTDGDPCGPLKKTVKELPEFDPKGSEYCRQLARRYSSRLFRIYRNNVDSFFHSN